MLVAMASVEVAVMRRRRGYHRPPRRRGPRVARLRRGVCRHTLTSRATRLCAEGRVKRIGERVVVSLMALLGAGGCGSSSTTGAADASGHADGSKADHPGPHADGGAGDHDTGSTGSPDTGGGMPAPNCVDCQAEVASQGGACYSVAIACSNDTACTALLTCIDGCTKSTCIDSCRSSNAAGVTDYEAFSNCLCSPPCKSLCSSACIGIGNDDAGSACTSCQLKATTSGGACFTQASSCNSSSACVTLLDCLDNCPAGDTPCQTTCNGAASDAGLSGVGAVDTCLCTPSACASACPSQCGG